MPCFVVKIQALGQGNRQLSVQDRQGLPNDGICRARRLGGSPPCNAAERARPRRGHFGDIGELQMSGLPVRLCKTSDYEGGMENKGERGILRIPFRSERPFRSEPPAEAGRSRGVRTNVEPVPIPVVTLPRDRSITATNWLTHKK